MFGSQIKFVAEVIDARMRPVDAGARAPQVAKRLELAQQFARVVMQIIMSLAVAGVALYVLLKSPDESLRKWASGALGLVLGYWLR